MENRFLAAFLIFSKKFSQYIERFFVLAILVIAYFYNLDRVPFHGDESFWISWSERYEVFIRGDFDNQIWKNDWPNLYITSMTYHVIGFARQFGGWEAEHLNQEYIFEQSFEDNLTAGTVPADDLLWWGRAGVTSMAISGIWLLFLLLRNNGNVFISYGWILIAISNDYLLIHLRRAMNEGVLFAFIMFSIFSFYKVISHWQSTNRYARLKLIGWCALSGIFAGLAGQTKLNGMSILGGIFLGLFLVTFREREHLKSAFFKLTGCVALVFFFFSVAFVLPNPVLYNSPAETTLVLLQTRNVTMEIQAKNVTQQTFFGFRQKFAIGTLTLNKYAPLSSTQLNFLFFGLGFGILSFRLWDWIQRKNEYHGLIALISGGIMVSLPVFFILMDWDRYFFLPVIFSTVTILFGLDFLIRVCYRNMRSFSSTIPSYLWVCLCIDTVNLRLS